MTRQTRGTGWIQEWHSTLDQTARARAHALRRAGLKVTVTPMGPQVTDLGVMRMSLLDIRGPEDLLDQVGSR